MKFMKFKPDNVFWSGEKGITTYRVGLWSDIHTLVMRIKHKDRTPWKHFFRQFRTHWLRKNYWNGYLAEFHYPPEELANYFAGKGWTRKAALKNLGYRMVASNLNREEWYRWNA